MFKNLILALLIAILGLIFYTAIGLFDNFTKTKSSFLSINTGDIQATTLLDNKDVGKTPLQLENLAEGTYELILTIPEESTRSAFFKDPVWKVTLSLAPSALTSVTREFGPSSVYSAGEILSFANGEGISIVSEPKSATVALDGRGIGDTPISISTEPGVHKLLLSMEGYFSREIVVNVEGKKLLIVEAKLAINPLINPILLEKGNVYLYQLNSLNPKVTGDSEAWAFAIWFFQNKLEGAPKFDLLVDSLGNEFLFDQNIINTKVKKGTPITLVYLSPNEGKEETSEAKAKINSIKNRYEKALPKIQILSTSVGFLNVRTGPGTTFTKIDQVSPGQKFPLLQEKPGWYKIKLPSKEGWINSQFAKKL